MKSKFLLSYNKIFIFYILLILAMTAWGETWVSAKILSRYMNADELIFWRFFITTIGMIFVLIIFKINLKESKKELFIALISAVILSLYNKFFFLGTKYGLASFGGVFVTTMNPIFTFLFIAFLYRTLINKIETLGLILGFTGGLFMLKIWHINAELFSPGNIYFLLAALTWPILTIISSKQKMKSAILFSFYMFLFTTIIQLFFIKFKISHVLDFDFKFCLNLLILSLWGTTFATTIYFYTVNKLGSKSASSFFFIVPVSALIFSKIFLNESITLPLIIGGILGLIAVYILNSRKNNEKVIINKK
jgi:drug/metabolite transporter (DMT)-like permease